MTDRELAVARTIAEKLAGPLPRGTRVRWKDGPVMPSLVGSILFFADGGYNIAWDNGQTSYMYPDQLEVL